MDIGSEAQKGHSGPSFIFRLYWYSFVADRLTCVKSALNRETFQGICPRITDIAFLCRENYLTWGLDRYPIEEGNGSEALHSPQ